MVMYSRYIRSILSRMGFLPKHVSYEVLPPEHLIHNDLEVMRLIVVNRHPD